VGLRFRPQGLRFRPVGLRFRPAGLRFRPVGLRFRPQGLRFRPVGLRFRPQGLRSSVFVFGSSFSTHPRVNFVSVIFHDFCYRPVSLLAAFRSQLRLKVFITYYELVSFPILMFQ